MFDGLKRQRAAVMRARSKGTGGRRGCGQVRAYVWWLTRCVASHCTASKEARLTVKGTPIIIVPAAPSSIINLYNVKQFLEEGTYVDTATAKAAMRGVKPTKVTIKTRKKDGSYLRFHVIDNVSILGDKRQWYAVPHLGGSRARCP